MHAKSVIIQLTSYVYDSSLFSLKYVKTLTLYKGGDMIWFGKSMRETLKNFSKKIFKKFSKKFSKKIFKKKIFKKNSKKFSKKI